MCNLSWTPHSSLEKDNSLNHYCVSPRMGSLTKNLYMLLAMTQNRSNTKRVREILEHLRLRNKATEGKQHCNAVQIIINISPIRHTSYLAGDETCQPGHPDDRFVGRIRDQVHRFEVVAVDDRESTFVRVATGDITVP